MSDLSKNGKVTLAKSKVKEAFEEMGVPIPNDFKKKPSKVERKLAHVAIEHLFVGVLQHLKIAEEELKDLIPKNKSIEGTTMTASALLSDILALKGYIKTAINKVASSVESQPTVDELDAIFEKLQEELKAALELAHNSQKETEDASDSSELPE